ncbi:unnamed protein product [Schistosoma intercalatum]|nr:unnamed protein product [Schistosoma intercalatum]
MTIRSLITNSPFTTDDEFKNVEAECSLPFTVVTDNNFELAEIEENMLNVPISCVNIVHSPDLENIQTPLNYYELNETDASNDFDDSKQNVDTMTDENLKDTTDSPEVSWEVAEATDNIKPHLVTSLLTRFSNTLLMLFELDFLDDDDDTVKVCL